MPGICGASNVLTGLLCVFTVMGDERVFGKAATALKFVSCIALDVNVDEKLAMDNGLFDECVR